MIAGLCSLDGCGRKVTARLMCRMHYLSAWRAGTVTDAPTRDRETVVCPADHAHDLEGCWGEHGCRCEGCKHLRKMERQRRRSRLRAYGRGETIAPTRVPAAPVREHMMALRDAGYGLERIADAAQVSRSAMLDVYYGPRGASKGSRDLEQRTVLESVALRILALTPEAIEAALLPAIGTMRRLQALVAIGYTESMLADRLGVMVSNLSRLILGHRSRVKAATYEATRELFDELWSTPRTGNRADRSRAIAWAHGWVGPLAWDDIDDPREQPNLTGAAEPADGVDGTAVELAVAGDHVRLTPLERRAAVTRLHAQRYSDQLIADRLQIADRTVLRIRQELGLVAFDQDELIFRDAA
ncbi:hypothetical protein [Cryobacterium sp. AP23]